MNEIDNNANNEAIGSKCKINEMDIVEIDEFDNICIDCISKNYPLLGYCDKHNFEVKRNYCINKNCMHHDYLVSDYTECPDCNEITYEGLLVLKYMLQMVKNEYTAI